MSSRIVYAAKAFRQEPIGPGYPMAPNALSSVGLDARDRVELDIKADVTPDLLTYVANIGGTLTNSFPQYRAFRASVPLSEVEQLANRPDVWHIQTGDQEVRQQLPDFPAAAAATKQAIRTTNLASRLAQFFRRRSSNGIQAKIPFRPQGRAFFIGPDMSGDLAHQANIARAAYGVDGSGVRIGVLSSGVDSLALEKAAGRLPNVNVLPGQAGSGDEGTAILEILYTLAPGAQLSFATSHGGEPSMAANIQALADAGCKIILDDVGYENEPIFQDGVIAQAVNAVTAAGVFYFSAAGNAGSASFGTASVEEYDFGVGTPAADPLPAGSSVVVMNRLLSVSPSQLYTLYWADPLGQSANDYDLFILDPTGTTVLASSTNVQDGSEDPQESFYDVNHVVPTDALIVVIANPGAKNRGFHLSAWGGRMTGTTTGATAGHNAAAGAFTIAAERVPQFGGTFATAPGLVIEGFNSDGPRVMFYKPDGTPITPDNLQFNKGNLHIAGGTTLSKPDLTGADGVSTGLSGFNPFYGTSAAVPHAAAIAALVAQANPSITLAGMREALSASAISQGVNWGAGVIIASTAVGAANCTYTVMPPGAIISFGATFSITTQPDCPWAVNNAPAGWTLFPPSGKGSATVTFITNAFVNASGSDEILPLSIGDTTFTVEMEPSAFPSGLAVLGSWPHLAAEGGWNTTFTMVNKSSQTALAEPDLYDNKGNPLAISIDRPQETVTPNGMLASSLYQNISPNALFVMKATGPADVLFEEGWARLLTTGAIDGFAIFHYDPSNQEAVVPLETRYAPSYTLAFDNTNGVSTGIAVANLSYGATAFSTYVVRDDTGKQIDTGTLMVPPGGHTSYVLADLEANIRGTIELNSSVYPLSTLGIRYTPPGTLTTIPALGNVGTTGGLMAHLASGAGWQTTFVLVNTGNSSAQAQLKFFGDSGAPLSLPLTFPQGGIPTSLSAITQTIATGASAWIQTSGPIGSALLSGSAQLTTTGNISGYAIFRYNPNGQEAVVPLESRNASSYLIAFDNTLGITTGIAMSSMSSQSVSIPVTIRDETGAIIQTSSISLNANGHTAFTLTDPATGFPLTANIRGTVEFDSPTGTHIGVLGIRSPPALTFTTLPALAK